VFQSWGEGANERCNHNKYAEQGLEAQRVLFERLLAEGRLEQYLRAKPERNPDREAPFCRALARLAPAVGSAGLKEPSVLVRGNYCNVQYMRCSTYAMFNICDAQHIDVHPLVESLWAGTAECWEEGLRRRAISVHTDTLKGQEEWQPDFDFHADALAVHAGQREPATHPNPSRVSWAPLHPGKRINPTRNRPKP
jgi:hypothetical protein